MSASVGVLRTRARCSANRARRSSSGPMRKSTGRVIAEPARDLVGALGVDLGLGQQHVLAALLVVVRGLQERCRLAGVHRPVAEVQLGHEPSVVATGRSHSSMPPGTTTKLGAARGASRAAAASHAASRAATFARRCASSKASWPSVTGMAGFAASARRMREPSNRYPRAVASARSAPRKCPIASSGSGARAEALELRMPRVAAGPAASTFCASSASRQHATSAARSSDRRMQRPESHRPPKPPPPPPPPENPPPDDPPDDDQLLENDELESSRSRRARPASPRAARSTTTRPRASAT